MTTSYDEIHKSAKNESSFAFAETTYDLSHQSRVFPAPVGIIVLVLSWSIHFLNFFPAILCPKRLNIYNYVTHSQYEGLTKWKHTVHGCCNCAKLCRCCCGDRSERERKTVDLNATKQQLELRIKSEDHQRETLESTAGGQRGDASAEDDRCCICSNRDDDENVVRECANCCSAKQNGFCLRVGVSREDEDRNCCERLMDCGSDDDGIPSGGQNVYRLTTRGRVWKYYCSTLCCCDCCTPKCIQKALSKQRFKVHHTGCYSCIPTELGAKITDKDRSTCNGISLNEYAEEYEKEHKFSLDPADTVLLKHLTVETLFCKYCYRPFDPQDRLYMDNVLLTPFWALTEILSIYLFYFLMLPLAIIYILLTLAEKIRDIFNDDESEPPMVPDYDRQYFEKETLQTIAN